MIISPNNNIELKESSLILGFFDGVHLGHREVISSAVNFAKAQNREKQKRLLFRSRPERPRRRSCRKNRKRPSLRERIRKPICRVEE